MRQFTPREFKIPALTGISATTVEEHIKLYQGYVKNANAIQDKIVEYRKDREANAYVIGELRRRLSFEYDGMRNHEVYFSSLEGGPAPLAEGSPLRAAIEADCAPFDEFIAGFKAMAASVRGIGWAVLWYDRTDRRLMTSWVDEQHLGHFNGCAMILGLDMWEHSYVADYQPSGKKRYIDDFFANLNWAAIEDNFKRAQG
ncbi:MAG: superoxide dismutase [Patescibacteria group bacterium]|nr:superoxide dismutase [Patescibacteria group bacterium]